MARSRQTKRARLNDYLAEARPARISEAERLEIQRRLAPVSESYLRGLLRASKVPLDPLVEGVRQESYADLERTLLAIGREYAGALEAGDRDKADRCRRAVIAAKDHARLAARNTRTSPEVRARKEEMISWMIVWLEDPALFPPWLKLRKRAAPQLRP